MFDWFTNLFKTREIDPEAGVPAGDYTGIGRSQGANEGTGEGGMSWRDMTKKQYADVGRAFQAQQVGSQITQSGINAGFDNAWLGEYEHAGSAEGQKI